MKRAPAPWLLAIVGASFLVRTAVGWLRATPVFFPDEYIYAALGRSFAASGRPQIRDAALHFPALLQPLITAPAWLLGDVDLAWRVVQTFGALAMSLAAIPVFLLARRLGLSARVALALSALAALVPDLVYASYVSSEALAYPLVLTAVYTGTRALTQPTWKSQLGFMVVAGLATLDRIQFALLPLAFFLAAAAVGARERRVKAALREQALPLGLFALGGAATLASGPAGVLGVYRGLLGFRAGPLDIGHWAALDAMTLAYAAGWIVVPGALLGLWLALARPRSRDELAFGALTALLSTALLLEAGFLQAGMTAGKEVQERYVFYAVPLLGLCFALYASRGWPLRIGHLALAAALVLVSVRLPLSAYAISATVDGSPVLYAVHWLTGRLGRAGDAASLVAVTVGLLSGIAVLASHRPRAGTPVVLGLALLAMGATSAGAVAFEVDNAAAQKRAFLPDDASWIDHAHVGRTVLLQAAGGNRAAALEQLFWNRSIDRVLLLPGASPIDSFGGERVTIGADGSLVAGGRPVLAPLLVDEYGSTVRLRGARPIVAGPVSALWKPTGKTRLALYATGRYRDGWLARRGSIRLWPATRGAQIHGRLTMTLTLPANMARATIRFALSDGRRMTVDVHSGGRANVDLEICATRPWQARFSSKSIAIVGSRVVIARASAPTFRADPTHCSGPRRRSPAIGAGQRSFRLEPTSSIALSGAASLPISRV